MGGGAAEAEHEQSGASLLERSGHAADSAPSPRAADEPTTPGSDGATGGLSPAPRTQGSARPGGGRHGYAALTQEAAK